MKLPEKIKGRNRIRDGAIVALWAREYLTTQFLAEKFKLTQRRIEQILRANHAFVPIDKEWEKKKRIRILQNLIETKKHSTEKDVIDVMEAQRKEIEGNEESNRSGMTRVIIIKESNGNQGQDRPVSREISVQSL